MLTLLTSLALAAPRPVVADFNAQALRWGELMVGTSGVHVGLLPRLQVGTRPLAMAAGFPNAGGRFQLFDTPYFDLAFDGSITVSNLQGLSMTGVGTGGMASVHVGRLSVHGGVRSYSLAARGMPEALPEWIVNLVGSDPLAEATTAIADYGSFVPAAHVGAATLRAAVELRVIKTGGLVLQGSTAVGGRADVEAVATVDSYAIDVGPGLPGVSMLDAATGPDGSWVLSVAWQQQLGPLHLRLGWGVSAVPYAWVPQVGAAHFRGGGFKRP
ncbi:MAG: hypothetical protein KTR31_06505 [Myxococcales bacterium]|nr:hypothetical protein [Myxococcales bacterium]